jgi:MFS family permease
MIPKLTIIPTVWFLILVNFMDRMAMSFAGPTIMQSLHIAPDEFGLILGSFTVGYILTHIPGGLIADRIGARPLLIFGPLFWAIFSGATGLVSTVIGFIVARFFLGVAEGMFTACYYKVIGDNFEKTQVGQVFSICSSAVAIAPAFVGAIVGWLIQDYGWRSMFYAMAVPALVAALGAYLFIPDKQKKVDASQPAAEQRALRDILALPSVWVIGIIFFTFHIAYYGYLGWMPSYLALGRHIDLKSAGPIGAIPYVFAFFGMIAAGRLADTWLKDWRPHLVAALCLGAVLGIAIAYQADALPMSVIGLSIAAFGIFGLLSPLGAVALELAPPESRAAYVGTFSTVGHFGSIAAPVVIGFMVAASGTFASGFVFMALSIGVSALGALILVPVKARES